MEATARQQQLNLVGGVCVLSLVLYLILGQLVTSNLEVTFEYLSERALSYPENDHDQGKGQSICKGDICLDGPNLRRARVMESSHFFVRMPYASVFKTYGRAVGPSGIFQFDMTAVDENTVRVDFTPQQEGVYQIWISSEKIERWKPPDRPVASLHTPWLHQNTLPMLPLDLTILPNPKAPARGCAACRGPGIADLPGQWVNKTELVKLCGLGAVGAMDEWVEDDFVWAARKCTYPFHSREKFLEHFRGANILLAGDSTVRGHFVDLQNWLWYGIGPKVLQGPYPHNNTALTSAWDGHVAGFNAPYWGFQIDFRNVTPNPFEVGRVRMEYMAVHESLSDFEQVVRKAWENKVQLAKYHYHATVLSYGLWGSAARLQFKCQVPAYFKTVFKHFKCRPSELRNFALGYFNFTLPNDDVLGTLDCSWRDFETRVEEPPGMKRWSEKCLERFPGRLVYRSAMARFEWSHACVGNHMNPRTMCQLNDGIRKMAGEAYDIKSGWDGDLLLMDSFNMTVTRPDRSLDGYHFFPRKCVIGREGITEAACDNTTWNPMLGRCCFEPNFPQIVSMTATNMIISLLWDDPLLQKGQSS